MNVLFWLLASGFWLLAPGFWLLLSEDIGAQWLVPMHYDMFQFNTVDVNRFIEHMLGHRPAQRFKVFQCGEKWAVPGE